VDSPCRGRKVPRHQDTSRELISWPSKAYNSSTLRIYAEVHQILRNGLVPFLKADVNLLVVLDLVHDKKREVYLIQSQNDLYQVNEVGKFFPLAGWIFPLLWQILGTFFSVLGALLLWPITWFEERYVSQEVGGRGRGVS
jgi:hypothetical protein